MIIALAIRRHGSRIGERRRGGEGAVFGPAGIPQPVLDKFHGELVKLFNQPDVRNQLGDQLGMDIVASSPAALQTFLVGEIERWGKVIRENRIRAD